MCIERQIEKLEPPRETATEPFRRLYSLRGAKIVQENLCAFQNAIPRF